MLMIAQEASSVLTRGLLSSNVRLLSLARGSCVCAVDPGGVFARAPYRARARLKYEARAGCTMIMKGIVLGAPDVNRLPFSETVDVRIPLRLSASVQAAKQEMMGSNEGRTPEQRAVETVCHTVNAAACKRVP